MDRSIARKLLSRALAAAIAALPFGVRAEGDALRVRVAAPETHVFESRITVQGTLEARSRANVSARVSGNLDAIWVDEGDRVVAGETALFQIDAVSLSNQVAIAEQALAVAKSNLAVAEAGLEKVRAEATKAERDFERYERLHKEGRVTDNEFEVRETQRLAAKAGMGVAQAQIELAKSQVGQAGAQLVIARKALADSRLVAPLDGYVSSRTADPGEFIAAGKPILTIVDTDDLEAAAFIPAQYFGRVAVGRTAFRLAVAGVDAGEHAVSYRSPVVDPALRTFEVRGKVAGTDALAPGMMADMTLVFESHEGLAIPSGAVLVRGGRTIVFVAENGKAVKREVALGLQVDGLAEVVEGLGAADRVIVEGHTLVRDGSPVSTR